MAALTTPPDQPHPSRRRIPERHRRAGYGFLTGEIEPTLIAVLSDINMPGMDGLQLLGEIKRLLPTCQS